MDNNNIEEVKVIKDQKPTMRDNLYGNLDVSVKTMDKVIVGLFGFLIIAIIIGVIM